MTEVPLSTDSLTSDDVFILDLGHKIIVWAGSAATGMEKNKALTYTVALRDDRDHKGTAQVSGVLKGHSRNADGASGQPPGTCLSDASRSQGRDVGLCWLQLPQNRICPAHWVS